MTLYEITLEIDSDTRPERLRETIDRIVLHTFGSSGEVTNFLEIDSTGPCTCPDTSDNDPRCCHCQATDDHNETVARQAGAHTYLRTDGTPIDLTPRRTRQWTDWPA